MSFASNLLLRVRDVLAPRVDLDPGRNAARIALAGLAIVVFGVFGLGGWALFAPLSGAVIAPGFVKVDLNRKVVQHQEGGILREILVRDGESVRQGQTLVVIEDVRVDAALDLQSNQYDSERAKSARLEAERLFAPKVAFPPELERRGGEKKVGEILQREMAIFRARRDALESQVAVLRRQIRETDDEAKAWAEQTAAEERASKLQKDELAANEALVAQGFVQKTRIMGLQRAVAEYEARLGEHRAEFSRSRQRVSELELRILTMRNTYMQTATDELKDTMGRIFDLEERLRPARDAAERMKVVAPIAGEVVGMKVFTPGSVVAPRELLMEILPANKRLIVEARLRPEDINVVKIGTEADIRLTAFKQRNIPLVLGTVSYISGDRLQDGGGQSGAQGGQSGSPAAPPGSLAGPYYLVHVDVQEKALVEAGNLRLQAGMPAEVFLRTDKRTAFDYLLAPVTTYLRRAMREPI